MNRVTLLTVAGLLVALTGACAEPAEPIAGLTLEPLVTPGLSDATLVRPRALAPDGSGGLLIVEEGRLSLTHLDPATGALERASLWPPELPSGAVPRGSLDVGRSSARTSDGTWVMLGGLGPVFRPAASALPPWVLGRASSGVAPVEGALAVNADLSGVLALATDADGALLLALPDRVARIEGGALRTVPGTAGLSLAFQVGMTTDPAGNLYVTDTGAGRIWRIDPDGQRVAVAGGDGPLFVPADPVPSDSVTLELGDDHLAWSEATGELLLLNGGALRAVAFTPPGQPTIRALPGGSAQASGVAVVDGVPVVAVLSGVLVRAASAGPEALYPTGNAAPVPGLGRAAALERVGLDGLMIADPARRQLLVWVEGTTGGTLWVEPAPVVPQSAPLAAGVQGVAYLQTVRGLRRFDLVVGAAALVGRPDPDPFAAGQPVSELVLPADGEVRGDDGGGLWLVDPGWGIVAHVAPDGGTIHVAGAVRGGLLPLEGQAVAPRQLILDAPYGLAARGPWVVVADHAAGGDALYAVNTDTAEARLAGRSVPSGQAVRLAGLGTAPPAAGLALGDTALTSLVGVALLESGLVFALDAPSSLWHVDADGLLSALETGSAGAPVALASFGDVLITADADGRIDATNLADTVAEIGGHTLDPGERVILGDAVSGSIVDLDADDLGRVAVLEADGSVGVVGDGSVEAVGEAAGPAGSLALVGGGVVVLDGGLWAVALDADAELFGSALPTAPGGRLLEAREEPDLRLAQVAFDDGASVAMAVDSGGNLWWVDRPSATLFRAEADAAQRVGPESPVERVTAGGQLADLGISFAPMAVTDEERVYLGLGDRVLAWTGADWEPVAGGGTAVPAVGAPAAEARLSLVTGVAVDGDRLWVRSREGLLRIGPTGDVELAAPALGSDPGDGNAVLLADSVAVVEGQVAIVMGGGVYRVGGL